MLYEQFCNNFFKEYDSYSGSVNAFKQGQFNSLVLSFIPNINVESRLENQSGKFYCRIELTRYCNDPEQFRIRFYRSDIGHFVELYLKDLEKESIEKALQYAYYGVFIDDDKNIKKIFLN